MKFNSRFKKLSINDFKNPFDLIVIGGGINGAGVANEAASRGLKVLLLEKNDFGSGTTAHSTRLIHGGLRYLEFFEFGLVYESLNERQELLRTYPHLVHPLKLLLPHYKTNRVGKFRLSLGMMLYDLLSWHKKLEPHARLTEEEFDKKYFKINKKNLDGAFEYYDAQACFAERICLENILAAQEKGALCINHAEVINVECKRHGKETLAEIVEFKDSIETTETQDLVYKAYGNYVINMAGPWVDKVNQHLDISSDEDEDSICAERIEIEKLIGGTKGSHIVTKHFPGAPEDFGVYTETARDHRPIFILPFTVGENETRYLIGTTDIFTEENPDKLEISDEEIDYLIEETNRVFPDAKLNRKSIVKTYSGIRPLPYISAARKEGTVTRRHFIKGHGSDGVDNYYSIVGGKLTTFRNLAVEIVNRVSTEKSPKQERSEEAELFYSDYKKYLESKSQEYAVQYELDEKTVRHLISIYGLKAQKVLEFAKRDPELKKKISPEYEDIEAQIVYAIEEEKACTVEDVFYRRLGIGLLQEKPTEATLAKIEKHLSAVVPSL